MCRLNEATIFLLRDMVVGGSDDAAAKRVCRAAYVFVKYKHKHTCALAISHTSTHTHAESAGYSFYTHTHTHKPWSTLLAADEGRRVMTGHKMTQQRSRNHTYKTHQRNRAGSYTNR